VPIGRNVPAQRRTRGLTLAQLFFGGKGKSRQISQVATVFAAYSGAAELLLVEERAGKQVIQLARQFGFLALPNLLWTSRLDVVIEIVVTPHGTGTPPPIKRVSRPGNRGSESSEPTFQYASTSKENEFLTYIHTFTVNNL
jgi:hypothetical protein